MSRYLITFAEFPPTIVYGGTSFYYPQNPIVIIGPSPILIFPEIVAAFPNQSESPISAYFLT